jgi:hypothetical protein
VHTRERGLSSQHNHHPVMEDDVHRTLHSSTIVQEPALYCTDLDADDDSFHAIRHTDTDKVHPINEVRLVLILLLCGVVVM